MGTQIEVGKGIHLCSAGFDSLPNFPSICFTASPIFVVVCLHGTLIKLLCVYNNRKAVKELFVMGLAQRGPGSKRRERKSGQQKERDKTMCELEKVRKKYRGTGHRGKGMRNKS